MTTNSLKAQIVEVLIDLGKLKSTDIPESYLHIVDLIDDPHKVLVREEQVIEL